MPTPAKTRRLTVCNKSFERQSIPFIGFPAMQLCGKWLKDAGFNAGHTINITHGEGKIIVTRSQVQRFDVK
jgi:hypothetical protein